jgi:two-component system, NtrC family, sensor kinase
VAGPAVTTPPALAVLVAGPDGAVRDALTAELTDALDRLATVHVGVDVLSAARELPEDTMLGLVCLLDDGTSVDKRIATLTTDPHARAATTVLLTERAVHDDLSRAMDADELAAVVAVPWSPGWFAAHARAQLGRWLRTRAPQDPRLDALEEAALPNDLPPSALLQDLELDEEALAGRLIEALDRALGRRPRLQLRAGTRLTHQGSAVDGLFVVLSGSVALDRSSEIGELRLHHASTGPVVGLLSLTQQRQAFFTARATTDVELIHISLEQLEHALAVEPEVGSVMAAATARALATRLRRSEQLQVEKVRLNAELDRERQQLADALEQLEGARLELVESARMATLGELSAGVAHELNNPAAAVTRAASFVTADLSRLLTAHPRGEVLSEVLNATRERSPLGTARQREIRRELAASLGSEQLARRLVSAGVDDPVRTAALAADLGPEQIEEIVVAAELGGALRNLLLGTRRITDLVASLKSYARPSDALIDDLDVATTIDDALQLVAHRLDGIELERRDAEDLPTIQGHPGPLGQVWTNLVLNAVDAMEGHGRLEVITRHEGGEVVVEVIDDGPGIAPEVLPRLFEPRFTTKHGRVRYGLGLGLAISQRIIHSHDGTITVTSEPGRTVATVRLPAA